MTKTTKITCPPMPFVKVNPVFGTGQTCIIGRAFKKDVGRREKLTKLSESNFVQFCHSCSILSLKPIKTKLFLISIFYLLYWFISTSTFAAGISVSPSSLELNGSNKSQTITVTNPTSDVQIFEVSADEFKKLLIINPASFTLEAGREKQVEIEINLNQTNNNQILKTNLSVLGRPLLEERFTVNTGVKIPLTINIQRDSLHFAKSLFDYKWLAIGILILITLSLLYKTKKPSI